MKTDTPRPIRLKDYRPPAYLIDTVHLDISLDARRTRVHAKLSLRPNPESKPPKGANPLVLDGEHMELESIALDGETLNRDGFLLTADTLTIERPPARAFTLDIVTWIDPDANKSLNGLYRSRGVYCSQCEAEGFRRITYFLDRPDILATYTTRIEADRNEAGVLLSNGNRTERGTLAGGKRHYAVWHDPHPKPCYLFAVVGGNLTSIASTFKTMSGRKVDLAIYVEPGKESRAGWAMDALKRSMAWDERRFGREYDLDVFNIVAVSDFNMGAMENKGLNIFNDRLILASPETATDAIYEAIESVVAHEYFHNWTGNRITCRDWFQLCLKEGLTVFRDQEFSADERSATVQRITDVRQLRATQFAEDSGPLAHPVRPESYIEINNFYTSTVYEKGAEVVRMIETLVGRDKFKAGMDLYFERHDGQAATVEQFIRCFEEACAIDLTQFRLWYSQSGTPELVCKLAYDKAKKVAELTVEQVLAPTPGQATKKPQLIPLRLALLGHNGDEIPLRLANGDSVDDGVLRVSKRSQTFKLVDVPSQPVASLLRGFSAPVKLTTDHSDRDLAFLMSADSDLFARWQAANDYALRVLVQLVRAKDKTAALARVATYIDALGATLRDESLEPAYRAEMAKLPTEADIAREIARNIDPAAIHAARWMVLREAGRKLGPMLEATYAAQAEASFSPSAASAGRRALRNAALSLLNARNTKADQTLLAEHYRRASNMTDQSHALYLLAIRGGAAADAALADFHAKWQHDHLVIDTWFTAQALSPRAGTLARLRKLLKDPLYSATAPNKVRALVGAFAMHNPVQFNRPDGKGYEWLANQVLTIESFNPQIAARLVGALRSWRTLEPQRRALAKTALKRIVAKAGLSRDVTEIATKMLE